MSRNFLLEAGANSEGEVTATGLEPSLAKWLSVRLRTKWFWVRVQLQLFSKIEKIHHRTLKVVYGIDDSYNNLSVSSNSVSIHPRHLQFLVTEIFKSISQINPEFMWSFFKLKKLS